MYRQDRGACLNTNGDALHYILREPLCVVGCITPWNFPNAMLSRKMAVGCAMVANDKLRKLSFTGPTDVGRSILRQGADRILKMSMELGDREVCRSGGD